MIQCTKPVVNLERIYNRSYSGGYSPKRKMSREICASCKKPIETNMKYYVENNVYCENCVVATLNV